MVIKETWENYSKMIEFPLDSPLASRRYVNRSVLLLFHSSFFLVSPCAWQWPIVLPSIQRLPMLPQLPQLPQSSRRARLWRSVAYIWVTIIIIIIMNISRQ